MKKVTILLILLSVLGFLGCEKNDYQHPAYRSRDK